MKSDRFRVIAICLMTNGDRILAFREPDSVKGDCYWRPLGGGIEFREHSRDAIIREMREEAGQEITDVLLLDVMENNFTMNGEDCHQIVFVYDARFLDPTVYACDSLTCHEHAFNMDFTASWRSLAEIESAGDRLVPEGLAGIVLSRLRDRVRIE